MQSLYSDWHTGGVLATIANFYHRITPIHWMPLLLAIFIPVLLIYGRNEIRVRRLRIISAFVSSYPATRDRDSRRNTDAADSDPKATGRNPSLEFVTSKYLSDLREPEEQSRNKNSEGLIQEIEDHIRSSKIFGNLGDYRLLFSAVGFMVLCYYGFDNLFLVVHDGFQIMDSSGNAVCFPLDPSRSCCIDGVYISQIRIVGSLAFAGGFIAAIRQFIRSLAVFDLSAYTFLWQTAEIFASVTIVMFLYQAFPDPTKEIAAFVTGAPSDGKCGDVTWIWLALAPVLGLMPQSSTKFLLLKMQSLISWVKIDDDRFNKVTRTAPLDVIDGIDYTTRFRLEECGIYDVQNLATYNPILLHIESPYGIYQAVDWVAQAQLCNIVGLDKFLLLRQMNVRTIFDLERSLAYREYSKDRRIIADSPDEFDKIYAGILFAATSVMRQIGEISSVQPFTIQHAANPPYPAAGRPPAFDNTVTAATIDAYCQWAYATISADLTTTKKCMEHLMDWMADDLHVRRLRRIWQEMSDDLGWRSTHMDGRDAAGQSD